MIKLLKWWVTVRSVREWLEVWVGCWWCYWTFVPCYCSKRVSVPWAAGRVGCRNCTSLLASSVPVWGSSLGPDRHRCRRRTGCAQNSKSPSKGRSQSALCAPHSQALCFQASGLGILCSCCGFPRLQATVRTGRNAPTLPRNYI